MPISDLVKIQKLNKCKNETIESIVNEMAAIAVQRLIRGFLARKRYKGLRVEFRKQVDEARKQKLKEKSAGKTILKYMKLAMIKKKQVKEQEDNIKNLDEELKK